MRLRIFEGIPHANRPLTVDDLVAGIGHHHRLADHVTRRHIRDALRYEVRRGRAKRDDLGRYVLGTVSERTASRIRAAEREIRPETDLERERRNALAYLKRQDDERRRRREATDAGDCG